MSKAIISKEYTVKFVNFNLSEYKYFHFWDLKQVKEKFNLTWKQIRLWKKWGILTTEKYYF